MKKIFNNALVFKNGQFHKTDFALDGNSFSEFGKLSKGEDLHCAIVIPGLFDIHTHGAVGISFNSIQEKDFANIANYFAQNGATSILATTITSMDETALKSQLKVLAKLCEQYPIFKGIHLEGPFLSAEFKGAMMEEFLLKPDINKFKEFQKAANGYIKLITVAPELEGAKEFISEVSNMGVAVSLGHSGATYTQTNQALESGARSFTHTFNAMKPLTHKTEGSILISALESDAYAEIIADGNHVNKDLFKLLVKCKGLNKIIGISDSLAQAGLPNGVYPTDDGRFIRKNDGDLFYEGTTTRAGSVIGIFDCLKNFQIFTNNTLETCLPVYTENPATMLGINGGVIQEHSPADFVVVKDNKIQQVYSLGNCIFKA